MGNSTSKRRDGFEAASQEFKDGEYQKGREAALNGEDLSVDANEYQQQGYKEGEWINGYKAARNGKDLPPDASDAFQRGYEEVEFEFNGGHPPSWRPPSF